MKKGTQSYKFVSTNSAQASSLIIAYNLKQYRKAKEQTQQQVADATGIALRTYQEIESGNANPTLFTLDILAQYHGIVLARLLTLNSVKLSESEEAFQAKLKTISIDLDIPVGIRDFDATILWGNRALSKITRSDVTVSPVSLISLKDHIAQGVILAQIESERRGIVHPYTNSNVDSTGNPIYFRIYPVLIYPKCGTTPLYSLTYLTPISCDTEERYYKFCSVVLECCKTCCSPPSSK